MAQSKINPQITTVEVGVRSLREVTIYPLSLADQTKSARIIAKAFQAVMEKLALLGELSEDIDSGGSVAAVAKQLSNVDVAEQVVTIIQDNLELILDLVTDENEKITMVELTNDQFYTLVEIIYEVNYEKVSKNFIALVKRAKGIVPAETPKKKAPRSKKQSQPSVDGITTD